MPKLTKSELLSREFKAQRKLKKLLLSTDKVMCLDQSSYLMALCLGLALAQQGRVVAKIIPPAKLTLNPESSA